MNKSKTCCAILCAVCLNISTSWAAFDKLHNLNLSRLYPKNWKMFQKVEPILNFEEHKGSPIGGKAGEEIKVFMLKQANKFKSINGAIISTLRNGEILKISIPASTLFLPNDTLLSRQAELNLRPVLTFMRRDLTKILITGHSDNTGSAKYIETMALQRALAVEEWFLSQGIEKAQMAVFAFGAEKPIFENDSMENRALNRRITIYLVPNDKMIKLAKRKRLDK